MITEAQQKAYLELKDNGDLKDIGEFKVSTNELYIHHTDSYKITAIHKTGIVTIHHTNKED